MFLGRGPGGKAGRGLGRRRHAGLRGRALVCGQPGVLAAQGDLGAEAQPALSSPCQPGSGLRPAGTPEEGHPSEIRSPGGLLPVPGAPRGPVCRLGPGRGLTTTRTRHLPFPTQDPCYQ